jgi:hypothetical protein
MLSHALYSVVVDVDHVVLSSMRTAVVMVFFQLVVVQNPAPSAVLQMLNEAGLIRGCKPPFPAAPVFSSVTSVHRLDENHAHVLRR